MKRDAVVGEWRDLEARVLESPEVRGTSMVAVVGPEEGWEDHVMRIVTVEPGGYTPRHAHPWPHINLVLDGEGTVRTGEEIRKIRKGSYAFLPSGLEHQFVNTGESPLELVCIVPCEGHV